MPSQLKLLERRVQQLETKAVVHGMASTTSLLDVGHAAKLPSHPAEGASLTSAPHHGTEPDSPGGTSALCSKGEEATATKAAACRQSPAGEAVVHPAPKAADPEGEVGTVELIARLQAGYQDAFAFLSTMQAQCLPLW